MPEMQIPTITQPEPPAQMQQVQSQPAPNAVPSMTEDIATKVAGVMSFLGNNASKESIEALQKIVPPSAQQQPPAPAQNVQQPAEPTQQAGNEPTEPAAPAATDAPVSPFFRSMQQQAAQSQPVTWDVFPTMVQKELNIDLTKEEGLNTFWSSVKTFRQQAQKAGEYESKVQNFNEFFENLPKDLLGALDKYSNGQDYRSVFSSTSNVEIDYEKDFGKLSEPEVIAFAKQLDPNFAITSKKEVTDNPLLSQALNVAYEARRNTIAAQKDLVARQASERVNSYRTAVESSVSSLATKYPNVFANDEINSIKSLLKPKALVNAIFDKDGNPKPDTAERIAFLLYGTSLWEDAQRMSQSRARLEGAAEALNSVNQNGVRVNGSPFTNTPSNVQEAVQGLKQFVPKKTY